MKPTLRKAANNLLEALFPSYCCFCSRFCEGPLPLCPDCRAALPANREACSRCALPLPPVSRDPGTDGGRHCGTCLQHPPPFDRVIAPWIYDAHFAHLIGRWKFNRQQVLTSLLAQLWVDEVAGLEPVDLLVPVPLHWRRLWQRGFNQATLLAAGIRERVPLPRGCPIATRGVRRRHATPPQSGSTADQRKRNLRAAFTVDRPCDNLRVAIVDDVVTTAATASALATALRAAGAARVEVWCLARTPAPGGA